MKQSSSVFFFNSAPEVDSSLMICYPSSTPLSSSFSNYLIDLSLDFEILAAFKGGWSSYIASLCEHISHKEYSLKFLGSNDPIGLSWSAGPHSANTLDLSD